MRRRARAALGRKIGVFSRASRVTMGDYKYERTAQARSRPVLCMMFIIWTLLIISSTSCIEVTETQEESDNITTLYPIHFNSTSNGTQPKTTDSLKTGTSLSETLNEDNKTESKEEPVIEKPINDSKEFKPSVHLGDFFDDDSFGRVPLPTKPSFDAFSPLKKPPSAFIGSHKDEHKLIHKPKTRDKFPYKFEDAILTRAKSKWRPTPGLETRPTSTVPVQVPAGGLYKKPDAFKDKPGFGADDEEFGLEFNDEKETIVKKRPNPWKSLLHLLTALIPVGIIISALTPSVITIHDTGPGIGPSPGVPGSTYPGDSEYLPPRLFKRSDEVLEPPPALPRLPFISERCRRRLLCELHSDKNYHQEGSSPRRGRACHKLRCDEPAALAQALRWLLDRPPEPNRF